MKGIIKPLQNKRGSYTVEASVTIVVILVVIFILIFSFLIMIQKIMLSQIAKAAVLQAAEVWNDSARSMVDGSYEGEMNKDGLYYRVTNDACMSQVQIKETIYLNGGNEKNKQTKDSSAGSLVEKKLKKVKGYITGCIQKTILKPKETSIEIIYTNNLLKRELSVKIGQDIKIPFRPFGVMTKTGSKMHIEGKGKAVVSEPVENIRNIDLLLEGKERVMSSGAFEKLYEKLWPVLANN